MFILVLVEKRFVTSKKWVGFQPSELEVEDRYPPRRCLSTSDEKGPRLTAQLG